MRSVLVSSLILAFGVGTGCGQKGSEAANASMLIVYTSGESFVQTEGKSEFPAKVGMIVHERESVRTGNDGSIDLQTRSGSAVRVRAMSNVTIAALARGETKISIDRGGLLASVRKADASESFTVSTPTAIAGVRGTTFSIDVGDDHRSTVRVLDGRVAMSVRAPALEKFTPAEIKADPNLQKLATLQQKEIVLEAKTQGQIDPQVEATVIKITESLAKSKPALLADISAKASSIEKPQPLQSDRVEIDSRELGDARSLVTVEPALMEKAVNARPADVEKEISTSRDRQTENVLKQITDEASTVKLSSEKEIQEHYNKLERVGLTDGTELRGAVIAQTDNVLLIHTTQGVKRVEKSRVSFQEPEL